MTADIQMTVPQVKEEELPAVRGSDGDIQEPFREPFIALQRSGPTCEVSRFWQWIDNGGNGRMILVALAPVALLLFFPALVALRLLALLCLPVSCLLPVYMILKGAVLNRAPPLVRAALVAVYLGVLAFCAIPYLFVWPFYGFLEVLPACIMTIPIFLASMPLAACGGIAGGVIWFLSGSDYYSRHSYRASYCAEGKKI
eukprot:Protomagalhaensia_wolfi_Nauph_80__4334@NODE_442_length_2516_cov_144_065402_g332_i0_p2_GENE_NODE_442_length_2516_cov_144_065402_g332_i0NODE_442_length_2516_cov_144_065402_g332_i0_p2_ORF_typecomplete_len199_score13_25Chitin_synth_2/PF03142_15/2_NODE_442_length_2516_cov_144_065402_g332_i06301226